MAEQFPVESTTDNRNGALPPETPASSGRPWWTIFLPVAMFICAFLAIGCLVVFVLSGLLFPKPSLPEPPPDEPNVVVPKPAPDADDDAIAALRAKEERSLRLAKLERFTGPRDQLERDLRHLAAEMTRWETFIKDLLDEDSGRHIASDPTYIEHFLPIYERQQIEQDDYESFQRRMAQLSEPIAIAENENSDYMPSESLLTEIETLQSEVSGALRTLEDKRKDAEAVQRFAANLPAAQTTLRTAIEALQTQQREDRIAQIAADVRQAQEETTDRLGQAEAKKKRLRDEVELARIAAENAKLQGTKRELDAAAAADAKRRELAAKEAQLRREFEQDRSKVESLLRPFISNGMTQPKGRQFVVADEEGPVSLARLRGTGALEPTADGRETLFWITSANHMNDRDLGGFPSHGIGLSVRRRNLAMVKEAQDLLIKYGDLMVKDGMLAK